MTIIALAALLCPASSNADDYVSRVWVADQGDGTYINPIIHANYSDPDVIAVGDTDINGPHQGGLVDTVTAKVKISSKADGQQSGLIVMGHDYCTLGLEKNGEKFDLVQTVCHDAEQGGAETRTLVTDMSPSRRYEAGLIQTMSVTSTSGCGWTRAANAHSAIASTA